MYLVKTYLDRSPIQGIGVFAGEDIPKGTMVWELTPGFDQVFDAGVFDDFPEHIKTYLRRYAFWSKGKIILCCDHGQYTNHSDTPNVTNWPDDHGSSEIALYDIKKGEEITSDYRSFDDVSREKLDFTDNS